MSHEEREIATYFLAAGWSVVKVANALSRRRRSPARLALTGEKS